MQDLATSTTYKARPEEVLQVLQRSMLDTLGLATIGSQSEMAQISHGKHWAQFSILMQKGIRHDAAPRTPRGNMDQPLTNAEISDKFHLFWYPALGSKTSENIENFCSKFAHLDATKVQDFLDIIRHSPEVQIKILNLRLLFSGPAYLSNSGQYG